MKIELSNIAKVIFWGIVIVGGFWLVNREIELYNRRKETELDQHLKTICGVIEYQQPNNTALYDSCMDRGYEEFGTTADDSGGFDQ